MRRSTCRPFTVRDALILTAATAVGFGLVRMSWPHPAPPHRADLRERIYSALGLARAAGIGMLAGTLAFLPVRLLAPRRRLDRLMSQPGMAGCCAAAAVILAGIGRECLDSIRGRLLAPGPARSLGDFLENRFYVYSMPIGPAVASAWLALLLGGRWRPERGWIDRLGIGIGAFWIAYALLQDPLHTWIAGMIEQLTR